LSKTSKKRGTANQPKNLLQFFRESPLVGLELDFDREREEGRSLAREALTPRKQLAARAMAFLSCQPVPMLCPSLSISSIASATNCHDGFLAES